MQLKVSDTRPTISVGKARDPGFTRRLYYKHELYYRHALYLGGKSFGAYPTISVSGLRPLINADETKVSINLIDDERPVIGLIGET